MSHYTVIPRSINNGKYLTTVYDKRDDFNFCIVNFPHLSSNMPSKPAYGVYISQLLCIARIHDTFDKLIKSTRFLVYWDVCCFQEVFQNSCMHIFQIWVQCSETYSGGYMLACYC